MSSHVSMKGMGTGEKVWRVFLTILAGFIMAVGLEVFVLPSGLLDGGVTGVSIMLADITGVEMSIFLFVLNIPFVYLGYKQIGKTFALMSTIGITVLTLSTMALHNVEVTFDDKILAIAFGGALLGIGVGLAMKAGGCLDGTETVAILLEKKLPFTVGNIVFALNLVIFGIAGIVFTPESAMYSVLTYFIANIMIDLVQVGLDESSKYSIVTDHYREITDAINLRLGRGVTLYLAEGGYSGEQKKVVSTIVSRLEEAKLIQIIKEIDPKATVSSHKVHEIGAFKTAKRDIH